MELTKTVRVHLTGKKAHAFYDEIYERDGHTCAICGKHVPYGVKYHHEPCGSYRSDEKEKVLLLCQECHYARHNLGNAEEVREAAVTYLQELYGDAGARRE